MEFATEFANDTGENAVVIYRCPVVIYIYKDQNGKEVSVTKTGQPATSMIPVDQYNDAVEYYSSKDLDPIPDNMLGTPGNPGTYRSQPPMNSNAVEADNSVLDNVTGGAGWTQYSGIGTVAQSISNTVTHTNDFTYGLDISVSVSHTNFGITVGGSAGFSYEHSPSSMNGQSVTKSGSVTGNQVEGYDFQWKFAAWDTQINGATVPVMGYLVQDVVAPPSPAYNPRADVIGEDSVTIAWERGARAAQQYRVYRLLEDGSYSLVGAVSGDQFTCTLGGLQPNTTYTYVVRGVAYEDDGDAVISVDSTRLVLRTRSENAGNLEIELSGPGLDADTGEYSFSGSRAELTANVYNNVGAKSTSYQWQLRRPGGTSGWSDLPSSGAVEEIGSLSGSRTMKLSLSDVDKSMDGSMLRCVVITTTEDGTPNYYYSDTVTLNIALDPTVTTLTIEGSEDDEAEGNLSNPYQGYAGYDIQTTTVTEVPVQKPVIIPADEIAGHPALTVYFDGSNYVGMGSNENGETEYYAVDAIGESYTAADLLKMKSVHSWKKEVSSGSQQEEAKEEEYIPPDEFNGTADIIDTDTGEIYHHMAEFIEGTAGASITYSDYWVKYSETGAEYYTRTDDTFNKIDASAIDADALRVVFIDKDANTLVVNAVSEPVSSLGVAYDRYAAYTVSGNTLSDPVVFWGIPDTNLYLENDEIDEIYANTDSITAVTQMEMENNEVQTSTPYIGTTLKLCAQADQGTGTVNYTFTNLDTGHSVVQNAEAGAEITWSASNSGLYRITATTQTMETTASSSAVCYYYARPVNTDSEETFEYQLLLRQGGNPVDSVTYNGMPVALTLQRRTAGKVDGDKVGQPGQWENVSDVSYSVLVPDQTEMTSITNDSYIPPTAGNYQFAASVDGVQAAVTQLKVERAAITVVPSWEGKNDAGTVYPPNINDITPFVTEGMIVETDKAILGSALIPYCSLYDANGEPRSAGGMFDVLFNFAAEGDGAWAAAELQSKYFVTLEQEEIIKLNNSVQVTYKAGVNGTLSANRVEPSGAFGFASGKSIPTSYGLNFSATPEDGFVVSHWTVKLDGVELDKSYYTISEYGKYQNLKIDSLVNLENLVDGSVLDVQVFFTNKNYTLSFYGDENGTVTATQNNNVLTSGISVAEGSSVAFTAQPKENYVVKKWNIAQDNGAPISEKNPDGTDYTGMKLVLDNITANTTVTVEFQERLQHTVTFGAVDSSGNPVSQGVSITAEGLTDGKAPTGGNVTFTATPIVGVVVQEWQIKRGDGVFETTAAAGNTFTLYNVQEDTVVHAVINDDTGVTSYRLTYGVTGMAEDDNGGTLTAAAGGAAVASGSNVLNNTPVDFTFTEVGDYEVVKWTVNGTDVLNSTNMTNYTVNGLTENTTVTVTVQKKPQVRVDDTLTNGKIDVTYTFNGETAEPKNGYVYTGTVAVVTAVPESDYVVSSIQGDETVNPNKANGEKIKEVTVTGDTVITAAFLAKPVVSIGDAANGETVVTGTVDGIIDTPLSNNSYVDYGTVIKVTLTPDKGYKAMDLDGFTMSGTPTDSDIRTAEKPVTADGGTITIEPAFIPLNRYEVAYSVVDSNNDGIGDFGMLAADVERKDMEVYATEEDKTAAASGTTQVYEDGTILLTAAPETGYRVKEWKIGDTVYELGGTPLVGDTLRLTAEQLAVYAQGNDGAVPQITVQFESGNPRVSFGNPENGTLTAMIGDIPFTSGGAPTTDVVFTVEPDDNYEVKEWRLNNEVVIGETGNTYTYSPEGRSVTVEVILQGIVLDVTASAGIGGSAAISSGTVRYNEQVTLKAEPDAGFAFEGWYFNGTKIDGAEATYTFTAVTNGAYEARFTATNDNTVLYRVNDSTMGTITAAANDVEFASGDRLSGGQTVVITVTPVAGYRVASWEGLPEDAQVSDDKTTVTIAALAGNLDITANLEKIPSRTITIIQPQHGKITAQAGGKDVTTVPDGTEVAFTVIPDSYWMFERWTEDAEGQTGSSFTMAVTKDMTIGAALAQLVDYDVHYSVSGSNGSVSGTADGVPMTPGETVQQPGGSKLVFTATPESGYMVANWTLNGETVTQENLEKLGLAGEHPLANTLTVDALGQNIAVTVEFEPYAGFVLPVSSESYIITDIKRSPSDTLPENEVRKGGDVTFTVGADGDEAYVLLSNLTVNGYDCITGEGTAAGCTSVSALKNTDGSYTVTITGVAGNIEVDAEARKLIITDGLEDYEIPQALKDKDLDSIEKIQTRLETAITGQSDGRVFMDIMLKYWNGTAWQDVSEDTFPEEGIEVILLYPSGTDSKDTFVIAHMLASRNNAGTVEKITHTKQEDGLHFQVYSLSPFILSWDKYNAPSIGGIGGGGVGTTTYTVTFDTQGGNEIESVRVKRDETVSRPTDPTREGYVFEGWFTDADCTDAFDFDTKITKNMTLYAKWTEKATDPTNPAEPEKWENPFTDVHEDDWFYDAVQYAEKNSLFSGVTETEFAPNEAITRGMLVTVLWRAEGQPVVNYLMTFEDVDQEAYYGEAVRWAASEEIVLGHSNEEFAPDDFITREQIAAILERYADYKGIATDEAGSLSRFTDAAQISGWALGNVQWAVGVGLIKGHEDGSLDPQGNTTRAEAAAILQRFLEM